MKREEIQQALSRLEKLYNQGHLSTSLFQTKKQELMEKWADFEEAPAPELIESARPPMHFQVEPFSPTPQQLMTRTAAPSDRPRTLNVDGIGDLVDRQTASEIRAVHARDRLEKPGEAMARSPSQDEILQDYVSEEEELSKGSLDEAEGTPSSHEMAQEYQVGQLLRERYKLINSLGSGGMGQVFLVEDERFGGQYAAKILHPWVVRHEPTISRFIQEFKIMEGLNHPGIVRTFLLDEDLEGGALFYLMEYVDGRTLQDELEEAMTTREGPPFTGQETLTFLTKLTEILQHTHQHRILHRDLKPTNIMMFSTEDGGYELKLLDFGLAKWMTETNDPALHTGHAGTFFYIAPEQLMGGAVALVAADVFSLGVILYQMLTGALPVAMAVPPSEINKTLPKGLDRVLRKAMHAHWQHRYQSVEALLEDFQKVFVEDMGSGWVPAPNAASKANIDEAFASPVPSGSTRDLMSSGAWDEPPTPLLEGSSSSSEHQQSQSPSSPSQSTPSQPSVLRRKNETPSHARIERSQSLHNSPISNAERIARLRSGGPHSSSRPGEPVSRTTGSSRSGGMRSSHPSRAPQTSVRTPRKQRANGRREQSEQPAHSIQGHAGSILCVQLSPDGRFAATLGEDQQLKVWDTMSWFMLHSIELNERPLSLAWSPVDDALACGLSSGRVFVWKILARQKIRTFPHAAAIQALEWTPNGSILLVGCADGTVHQWDVLTNRDRGCIQTRQPTIQDIALDQQHGALASAGGSQHIKIWNLAKHSLLVQLSIEPEQEITCMVFAPKASLLLTGSTDRGVRLWDMQTKAASLTFHDHQELVTCVVFSPDGRWFASADEGGSIHIRLTQTGELLKLIPGKRVATRKLVIHPDGNWLLSVGDDELLKVWDTATWRDEIGPS